MGQDGDPDKEEKFFVLAHTIVPAVLVELGFFTNREEAIKMNTLYWRKKLALQLFEGIQEIIKN